MLIITLVDCSNTFSGRTGRPAPELGDTIIWVGIKMARPPPYHVLPGKVRPLDVDVACYVPG
ncbi:MAG: hypothetical protein R2824_09590 [Saprospiraceae bacterium]|nr:hypothetical protein [Lewinella sp.]